MNKEPILLNLETSTDICSVAVSLGGEVLNSKVSTKAYQHAELLTTFIQACLSDIHLSLQDIDGVAISSGPGSYTSLRVGTSTAKGLCYSLGLPLICVDTLQALALAAHEELGLDAYYCPMIDARRMEVYCAIYDSKNKTITGREAKIVEAGAFDDFFAAGKNVVFTGNGAEKCRAILSSGQALFHPLTCSANHMAVLANRKFEAKNFEDIANYAPIYLKPPNITKAKNMRML